MKFTKLLSALMACTVMAAAAPAYENFNAGAAELISSGECGDNINWTLDENGLLTISGTGEMQCSLGPWYDYRDNIKKVIIGNGVTSIAYGAFMLCTNLSDVSIPDSVAFIDKQAFYDCDSLTSITIPASVTDMGVNVFGGCDKLTEISVDDNNPSYADKDGVLFNKNMTTLIRYPQAKADSSYTIPYGVEILDSSCFTDSLNLTKVIMPNTLEQILYCNFTGCDNITEFTIPESVWAIGTGVFNCDGMQSITIKNPDCYIADHTTTIANNFRGEYSYTGTIYGYENSTAQTYAEKYGYQFSAITSTGYTFGDVNLDGAINALDASLVLTEYAASSTGQASTLDDTAKSNADINSDGAINALDASYILSYYAYTATGGTGSILEFI